MTSQLDIQIVEIEEELKRLWEADREKKQVKACLFNLIIFAPDLRRATYLKLVVQSIIEKFPCRLQFIYCNDDPQANFLHVDASTVSTKIGEQMIACEQISLHVSKNLLNRIPFLVIPHFVPDLPIYLLWGQNPVEEQVVLPALLKYANRLIFDSECLGTSQCFNQTMLDKVGSFDLDIMDMNWALTSSWRTVIFQIFDSSQKIEQLRRSKRIDIAYNQIHQKDLERIEVRAHYVHAWLAAQLGWQFQAIQDLHPGWEIIYRYEDRPITVNLVPRINSDLLPGSVVSIEIISYDEHLCLISRKAKHSAVAVYNSSPEQCDLPYMLPLPNLHRGFAFLKEIFYNQMGSQYSNMLQIFNQIAAKTPKGVK